MPCVFVSVVKCVLGDLCVYIVKNHIQASIDFALICHCEVKKYYGLRRFCVMETLSKPVFVVLKERICVGEVKTLYGYKFELFLGVSDFPIVLYPYTVLHISLFSYSVLYNFMHCYKYPT